MPPRFLFTLPVAAGLASLTGVISSPPNQNSNGNVNRQTNTIKEGQLMNITNTSPSPSSFPISGPPITPSPSSNSEQQRQKYRMPSRFMLEDPEEVQKLLRPKQPPIGDAALHSGLGVEVSTW